MDINLGGIAVTWNYPDKKEEIKIQSASLRGLSHYIHDTIRDDKRITSFVISAAIHQPK